MLVAISVRQDRNPYGELVDVLEHAYVKYFESFGLQLVVIPNGCRIEDYFEQMPIERIIITGGNDVDPKMYGEVRPQKFESTPERDKTENDLIDKALQEGIPLLAICRGMQFINAKLGGELVDLRESGKSEPHVPGQDHLIKVTGAGTTLAQETRVNSWHNYGISTKHLAPSLSCFARSEDGLVEGYYFDNQPLVGMQWHPERESPDQEFNQALVRAFVAGSGWWKV